MKFNIDKTHVTRVQSITTAKIIKGQITIWQGGDKANILVDAPFALDIWQLKKGYQIWVENLEASTDGKKRKHPQNILVPFNEPTPTAPDNANPIFAVPIYSQQIGGRADLIFEDTASTEALDALIEEVNQSEACEATDPFLVPIVRVHGTEEGDNGTKPVLVIEDWKERPDRWGKPHS